MHGVDRVDHLAQQPLLGAADRDDDAELRRAGRAGGVRGGEDLVHREERIDVDAGLVTDGLRAERAVFGARTRLRVDEALELDLGTAPRQPHLVREGDERRQLVERQVRDGARFGVGSGAGARASRARSAVWSGMARQPIRTLPRSTVQTRALSTGPIISA